MLDVADSDGLKAWLEGNPLELACTLAARAALRVVPVLGNALREDAESRRRIIVLAGFRALAAASIASTWPRRMEVIRKAARAAAHATETVYAVAYGARLSVVDLTDVVPDEHESIRSAEADAGALCVVEYAVDAAAHAVQAAVALVSRPANN